MTRRNCTEFDKISRALFNLGHQDITDFENEIVSRPRGRKGSIKVAEQAFMKVVTGLYLSNQLEVGGNDGRQSRRFLEETSTTVHTFEPNVFAIPFFAEIVSNERFRFNPFGLSDRAGLETFNILTGLQGRDFEPVNGCSSFAGLDRPDANYRQVAAIMQRGDTYVSKLSIEGAFGLWVDVEGYAKFVLEGFGDRLANAAVVLCETEVLDLYSTGANADDVVRSLQAAGHEIVFRDFQNFGQFNILSVHQSVAAEARALIRPILQPFMDGLKIQPD